MKTSRKSIMKMMKGLSRLHQWKNKECTIVEDDNYISLQWNRGQNVLYEVIWNFNDSIGYIAMITLRDKKISKDDCDEISFDNPEELKKKAKSLIKNRYI